MPSEQTIRNWIKSNLSGYEVLELIAPFVIVRHSISLDSHMLHMKSHPYTTGLTYSVVTSCIADANAMINTVLNV